MTDESRQHSTNINVEEQVDELGDQMRQMELNAPPPPPPQTTTLVHYNGGPITQVVYDQYGRQYTTSIISPTTPTMMQSPASPNTPPPIIIWTSTPPSTPFAPVNPFAMPTTPISMNTFAPPSPMSSPTMIIYQGGPPPQQQIADRYLLSMIMPPPPPTTVAMEHQQIQCEMGQPNDVAQYEPPATSTPVPTPTPTQGEPPTPIPPAQYTPGAMVYEDGPPPPPPQYYSTNQQYYHESPFVMPPSPSAPPPAAIVINQHQHGFDAKQPRNVQYGPPAISTPMTSTPPSTPFAPVNPFAMPTTPISMNQFAPPSPMSLGIIIYQNGPPPHQHQVASQIFLPVIMAPPPPTMEQQQIENEMEQPNDVAQYEPPVTPTPVPTPTPTPAQYEPPTPIPPASYTPGVKVYEGGTPPPPPQYYSTNHQYYHGSPFVMTPSPLDPPPTAIVMNRQQFGCVEDQPSNVQYGPPAISTPMTPLTPITQLVPMHRYPTPTPTPPFTVMGYTHTAFSFPSPNNQFDMAQPSGGSVGMARSPIYYGAQSMMPTMAEGDYYEPDQGGRRQWNEGRRARRDTKRGNDGGCSFCKRNGESREYFSSHQLRDPNGRVECPILRAFECPYCGATGDDSHTASYCPNRPPDCKSFSRIKLNRSATGRIRNSKK